MKALLLRLVRDVDRAMPHSGAVALIELVAEAFLNAVKRSPKNTIASREEEAADAVELVRTLYGAESLRDVFQSEEHHPTAALFVQELLALAFQPANCDGWGPALSGRAQQACALVIQTVGCATCRLLLPGVSSVAARYLATTLESASSRGHYTAHVVAAADVWRAVLLSSFSGDVPASWTSVAAPKSLQLLTSVFALSTIALISATLCMSVADAVRELLEDSADIFTADSIQSIVTGDSSQQLLALREASLVLKDLTYRGPYDDSIQNGGTSKVGHFPLLHIANDLLRRPVFDVCTLSLWATVFAEVTRMSSQETLAFLTDGDVLWSLLQRCVKFLVTVDEGLGAVQEEQRLCCTSASEVMGMASVSVPKRWEVLVEQFLRGCGAAASDDVLERLVEVLDDWELYEQHPYWIYVAGRLTVARVSSDATRLPPDMCLQRYVSQQRFEGLWEAVAQPHLWCSETDWEHLTTAQRSHRALIGACAMAAARTHIGALEMLDRTRGSADMRCHRAIGRVGTLLTYGLLEKMSSSHATLRSAAQRTLECLMRAQRCEGRPFDFFGIHCRNVSDEAQRSLLDPEQHLSAVNVLTAFCKILDQALANRAQVAIVSGTGTEEHSPGLTAAATAVPLLPPDVADRVCSFLHEVQRAVLTAFDSATGLSLELRNRYKAGCVAVLNRIATTAGVMVTGWPRVYPSEDNWDDERRWTSAVPSIARIQEELSTTCLQRVLGGGFGSPSCALTLGSIAFAMKVASLHVGGDGVCLVRTHLNTAHQVYSALQRVLHATWRVGSKDEGLKVVALAQGLTAASIDSPALDSSSLSLRTRRTTLCARGRWLDQTAVGLEIAQAIHALIKLLAMAPRFLAARMVEDMAKTVLVWYVRCQWMPAHPTQRESNTRAACVSFLDAVARTLSDLGFEDLRLELVELCRGVVVPSQLSSGILEAA